DPAYDAAFQRVALQLAQSDPRAAARVLDEAPPSESYAQNTASEIAMSWAREDPRAAAESALRRSDEVQRTVAVGRVASVWAERDAVAATDWARGLPAGSRDAALGAVLTRTADAGTADLRLLSLFSSDDTRQLAAAGIAVALARRDVGEARAVMDAYVRDPELRRQIERSIERTQALSPGSAATPGN